MSVGGQIMPVFEQLGLYDKYVDMAKPFTVSTDIRESGESLPALDLKVAEDMYVSVFVFLLYQEMR